MISSVTQCACTAAHSEELDIQGSGKDLPWLENTWLGQGALFKAKLKALPWFALNFWSRTWQGDLKTQKSGLSHFYNELVVSKSDQMMSLISYASLAAACSSLYTQYRHLHHKPVASMAQRCVKYSFCYWRLNHGALEMRLCTYQNNTVYLVETPVHTLVAHDHDFRAV